MLKKVSANELHAAAMKAVEEGTVNIATEEDDDFVSATAVPAYSGMLKGKKVMEKLRMILKSSLKQRKD